MLIIILITLPKLAQLPLFSFKQIIGILGEITLGVIFISELIKAFKVKRHNK